MATLEEEARQEAEADAERLRARTARDAHFGNPFRRVQREEAQRRERQERRRREFQEAEAARAQAEAATQEARSAAAEVASEPRARFVAFAKEWGDALRTAHRELDEALSAMDDLGRLVRARARVDELEAIDEDLRSVGRPLFAPPRTPPMHPLRGSMWWSPSRGPR